jgi:hypothetical protein
MEYETYISSIKSLEADAKKWSNEIRKLKGTNSDNMGLAPDKVRFSPEYKQAKKCYSVFFNGIRKLNGMVPKSYLKRAAIERRNLREKSLKA